MLLIVIPIILLDCEDGDIRLLGGSSSLEGRVEVCYSGVWGTVCDNQWTNADAAVTCRQLGYSSSGTVVFIILMVIIIYLSNRSGAQRWCSIRARQWPSFSRFIVVQWHGEPTI